MRKMVGGYFMAGLLVNMLFNSCLSEKSLPEQEERVFINIDGHAVELVVDEYDNAYLKQKTACGIVYIPFTFPTEEDEIPRIYETTKSKKYDTFK